MSAKDKVKTIYECVDCGAEYPKWTGQCAECEKWNTLEPKVSRPQKGAVARQGYAGTGLGNLVTLDQVISSEVERISTGFSEFDRVLGGGLVTKGTVLLAGNPGAGKSTLLLQTGCNISRTLKTIYFTGEESLEQIKLRAERLSLPLDRMLNLVETDVTVMAGIMEREKPSFVIVDSIQTCYHPDLDSLSGNITQLKTCAVFLNNTAKRLGISLVVVGHITKGDEIAGPMALIHILDAILMLSSTEDARYRIMRTPKNRHGDTSEIGVFAMTSLGMKVVDNPSAIFLARAIEQASGSIVVPLWEGSRTMLVEVQALMHDAGGNMRPVCVGIDDKRVAMLLAVLNKHTALQTAGQAVYMNVVGGIKVNETSSDLPLLLAAVSSFREFVIAPDVMSFGEIGLSGEVRPCANGQDRIREAAKLGFRKAIVPLGNMPREEIKDMQIYPVATLAQAVDLLTEI